MLSAGCANSNRSPTTRRHHRVLPVSPLAGVASNRIGVRGGNRRRSGSEIRLAMWLVILEIIFWLPVTVMSILGNLRIALPFPDVNALAFSFGTVLHIVDPLVYLVFLGNVRQEIISRWYGVLGLETDQRLPVANNGGSSTSGKTNRRTADL
ncbi:hypothetical protein BV898_16553 [Hypsibius exemplaris]|uniref:G-protein coupled receptors family 1 profile domain-containing protein n=1 Tax=Hypsibius exemplaris TaxID=2072580 RepID=A0A9X6NDY2_HYPEX|nr:hypothetical protein BV898_16553 [Hypsibius exemplaris]